MSRMAAHCIDSGPHRGILGNFEEGALLRRTLHQQEGTLVQVITGSFAITTPGERSLGVPTLMEKHALCLAV